MSTPQGLTDLVRELRNLATGSLSDVQIREVDAFIEVGEYGLALQTLADIYREDGIEMPDVVYRAVFVLSSAMNLDAKEVLNGSNLKL